MVTGACTGWTLDSSWSTSLAWNCSWTIYESTFVRTSKKRKEVAGLQIALCGIKPFDVGMKILDWQLIIDRRSSRIYFHNKQSKSSQTLNAPYRRDFWLRFLLDFLQSAAFQSVHRAPHRSSCYVLVVVSVALATQLRSVRLVVLTQRRFAFANNALVMEWNDVHVYYRKFLLTILVDF